jgi:hypothetical protein
MSGLFRRRRSRAGAGEDSRTGRAAAGGPDDAPPGAERPPAGEAPLAALRELPAGAEPAELRDPSATARGRGRARRRVRYLLRARELLLRDLGGLVYEIQRRGADRAAGERLVSGKLARLTALDDELRGLQERLGTPRGQTVLREPGIGGICPSCGEPYPSGARFCSACGTALTGAAAPPPAAPPPPPPDEAPTRPLAATGTPPPAPEAPRPPARPSAPSPTR